MTENIAIGLETTVERLLCLMEKCSSWMHLIGRVLIKILFACVCVWGWGAHRSRAKISTKHSTDNWRRQTIRSRCWPTISDAASSTRCQRGSRPSRRRPCARIATLSPLRRLGDRPTPARARRPRSAVTKDVPALPLRVRLIKMLYDLRDTG